MKKTKADKETKDKTKAADSKKRPHTPKSGRKWKRGELNEVSPARSAAAKKAMRSRWGAERKASCEVRVDKAAYDLLQKVPERDRRQVATIGVQSAAEAYLERVAAKG